QMITRTPPKHHAPGLDPSARPLMQSQALARGVRRAGRSPRGARLHDGAEHLAVTSREGATSREAPDLSMCELGRLSVCRRGDLRRNRRPRLVEEVASDRKST